MFIQPLLFLFLLSPVLVYCTPNESNTACFFLLSLNTKNEKHEGNVYFHSARIVVCYIGVDYYLQLLTMFRGWWQTATNRETNRRNRLVPIRHGIGVAKRNMTYGNREGASENLRLIVTWSITPSRRNICILHTGN